VHNAKDGVWLSSSEAGLTKIDAKGIHPIPDDNPFFKVKIKTIASDAKGNIWAGSDDRGILFRETKKVDSLIYNVSETLQVAIDTISKMQTQNHIIDERKGFPTDWIRKIVPDEEYIWAATYASGIVKFNYDSDKDSLFIRKVFGKKEGLIDLRVNDFVKDADGKFWFGTRKGHLGYIADNKVVPVKTALAERTSIASILLKEEDIFLGTSDKGIWYANRGNLENFQQLKGAKALSSKNIYQLIFDAQGYLWAGTERGVDKIELNATNEIVDVYHFGRNDGFLGIETCLNAVDIDAKGNLWFGTINGLTQHVQSENIIAAPTDPIGFCF